MRIKSQRNFWAGLMFVAVGLGFAWGARYYQFGSSARPGPGYFPFGLGLLLAILGGMVLFGSLFGKGAHDDGEPVGAFAWKPLLVVVVSVMVFGWLLPRLGMAATLPLLVVAVATAGDEFHLGEALLNAAILTIGSWLVFIKGLSLTIPLWPTFLGG